MPAPHGDLRAAMRQTSDGLVVKPILMRYITRGDLYWPEMTRRGFGNRPPDGWFHPSTHPCWTEAALYDYLVHPERIPATRRTYPEVMSLLFGVSVHGFGNWAMREAGLLDPRLQVCRVGCSPEECCTEPSWYDEGTGERGHADGMLDEGTLWELKTTGAMHLRDLDDLDTEGFLAKFSRWGYDEQAWRYQRMSGARRTIFTVVAMGNPWEMREFHLEHDAFSTAKTTAKYRRVRQAASEGRRPSCGCVADDRVDCPAMESCR